MSIKIKQLIEQVVKEEMAKLGEVSASKVNPKYNVFAVDKHDNKIINGWDLDPKDKDNIQDYTKKTSEFLKQDLKDLDVKPAAVSILSLKALKAKNIDPFKWDNWKDPSKIGQDYTRTNTTDEIKEDTTGKEVYIVVDLKGNSAKVSGPYSNRHKATSAADKKDNEYGGYRYKAILVKPEDYSKYGIKEGEISETTIIATQDGTTSTATPAQKTQAQTATAAGDDVKIVKTGEQIQEKKKEEDKEDPEEDSKDIPDEKPVPENPDSLSATLADHISSAINAAAKCIQDSDDKKYERVLGKVVKNLTAAQSSLDAVRQHEDEINEKRGLEEQKETEKFTQLLRKAFKPHLKNPADIDTVIEKYKKTLKKLRTNEPEKVAEAIWKHALREGFTPTN